MSDFGTRLPEIGVPPPGPASRALLVRLARVESRNVTWQGEDFPVVWTDAVGANVRDADGNVHLDLTAAFGVALAGHAAPEVVAAIRTQTDHLVHGMGDVHPPAGRIRFLEDLAELLPFDHPRITLATGGAEAVEIALKTAQLATGRPGVIAFRGGYHGLTAGALAATARPYFREPFRAVLHEGVTWLPFPTVQGSGAGSSEGAGDGESGEEAVLVRIDELLAGNREGPPIGAVLIEPVQARGGVRVLSPTFARRLGERVRQHGALLIADEIYTGMGRCGAVLASRRVGLDPHLVCLGKVLGGGLPIGACAGPAEVMDAWPDSPGEALHTSTFLGHPLASAAGRAICGMVARGLPGLAERLGTRLRTGLTAGFEDAGCRWSPGRPGVSAVRGLGLLLGFDLLDADGRPVPGGGFAVAKAALRRGVIVLPAGDDAEVVELSPPAVLTEEQTAFAVGTLVSVVHEVLNEMEERA